ncbi:MAG TPA: heterodisulfide reductase-related iron-sulfur binding cluster [Dehalococcoidia bacterium]|nr:heterodisulfide reductase-related iron-sulfur binding cluster [Dehalococcoidia bacterium]
MSSAHVAPSLAGDIARCVHCGFCLQACPTYLDLGTETDSPRGRIALIDALTVGRADPTPALLGHLDLCLQCRACESACPSGVPFGRIMEGARAAVMEGPARPRSWRLRAAVLRALLPHPARVNAVMRLLRLYERSPLRPLVRRIPALRDADAGLPALPRSPFQLPPQPAGLTRSVAMLTGCVMGHMYPRTHAATVRVLNRLGYRVILPEGQTCCGALSLHAGDRRLTRSLARRNIDAFLVSACEAVIVNSAGCGSTMKEYGDLLADDAAYAARAAEFAAATRDVLEFVADHELGPLGAVPGAVTYQDSCHLVHAQRVTRAPRAILAAIPGLELREMTAPDRCCGSAGLYSLAQPAMSRRLLEQKMDDVAATGALTVATANPGCMSQIEAGMPSRNMRGRVTHVIELLDAAMQAAEPRA